MCFSAISAVFRIPIDLIIDQDLVFGSKRIWILDSYSEFS